jgi:hypothetical protein
LKSKALACIALISVLLILPIYANFASAQASPSNYYVTVKPTTADSPMYTAVGRNWTLSFQATWTYGANEGQAIQNATAAIQVKNKANQILETLSFNTTTGAFTFNYASSTADVLTFTPTKLTTSDGKDWKTGRVDSTNNVYGFNGESAVVWYDTFHVSLVSSDTGSLGKVGVTVNVTYLLLPEEGLTLPAGASYNGATFLPKIAQGLNVTINGVKAQESQTPGIYVADSSTFLPTAYVNVKVSQDGWNTTSTGFSFAQNSNQPLWIYGIAAVLALTLGVFGLHFFKSRKANSQVGIKHPSYPFFGGVLLAVTAVISLYWGIVGLEATSHTFNWLALGLLGVLTFVFGITASLMAIRKRNQAAVIFAVIIPILMNLVAVKASLDMYSLANPWLIFVLSIFVSVLSGYFICNSDANFQQANPKQKSENRSPPETPQA